MLTNTWLGIVQQMLVERYLRSKNKEGAASSEITVKEKSSGTTDSSSATNAGGDEPVPALGKGNARV